MAKSISKGYGYSNMLTADKKPISTASPAYPLIMAVPMLFTNSVIVQKVMNSIFLGISIILLYYLLLYYIDNKIIITISLILLSVNDIVLAFTNKMMTEPSYILFSIIIIYLFHKFCYRKTSPIIYKDSIFLALILLSSFIFHIRFQSIALVLAILLCLILLKKNRHAILYFSVFCISSLPWIIRNKIYNLNSVSYFDKIMAKNMWRVEEGRLDFIEFIVRFFKNINMLISRAIPDSIIPSYNPSYQVDYRFWEFIIGYSVLAIIIFGLWVILKKKAIFILSYIFITLSIISSWSAPSEDRYLVGIVPVLIIFFISGISFILKKTISVRFDIPNKKYLSIIMIGILLLSSKNIISDIGYRDKKMEKSYKWVYTNYIKIANMFKSKYPKGKIIVATRKPTVFNLYSDCYSIRYPMTDNPKEVLEKLVEDKVDYLVVSTVYNSVNYILKTCKRYENLFHLVYMEKKPDIFVIKFDKLKAKYYLDN
jgi:hypothetical protein